MAGKVQDAALLADIRACRLCAEHLPQGPRPVLQWSRNARILVVGQAPGTRVHATGIPFNDPSGKRLRSWMGIGPEVFYDPERIALLPMGFCYPGTGSSGDLPPRPECAATWRHALLERMQHVQLTLALGDYAQRWHMPGLAGLSLTERVADWCNSMPALMAMPHPSPRNNRWLVRNPWFEQETVPALRQRVMEVLGIT